MFGTNKYNRVLCSNLVASARILKLKPLLLLTYVYIQKLYIAVNNTVLVIIKDIKILLLIAANNT
jgi:hypothetical protein